MCLYGFRIKKNGLKHLIVLNRSEWALCRYLLLSAFIISSLTMARANIITAAACKIAIGTFVFIVL